MNLDKKVEISTLYGIYGVLLTNKQREFVEMFYNLDMSLAEIAESASISRQAVRDALVRSVDALYGYEQALGTVEQVKQTSNELSIAIADKDWAKVTQIKNELEERYGIISRS